MEAAHVSTVLVAAKPKPGNPAGSLWQQVTQVWGDLLNNYVTHHGAHITPPAGATAVFAVFAIIVVAVLLKVVSIIRA
jgi:hypothetical protein